MRNSQDFIISSKALYPSFMVCEFFLGDDLSVKRGDAGSVFAMILEIPHGLVTSQEVHQPWDMTNSVGPFSEYNRRA